MKLSMMILFANLARIAFAVGAVFLAYHGRDGWGWMIFASILTGMSISSGGQEEDGEK